MWVREGGRDKGEKRKKWGCLRVGKEKKGEG